MDAGRLGRGVENMPGPPGHHRGALAEHAERGSVRKPWAYQAIPTLAQLVYVDAARVRVEIATRAPDGRWLSVFLDRLDETLGLEALGIELALREIYASTSAANG